MAFLGHPPLGVVDQELACDEVVLFYIELKIANLISLGSAVRIQTCSCCLLESCKMDAVSQVGWGHEVQP